MNNLQYLSIDIGGGKQADEITFSELKILCYMGDFTFQ